MTFTITQEGNQFVVRDQKDQRHGKPYALRSSAVRKVKALNAQPVAPVVVRRKGVYPAVPKRHYRQDWRTRKVA
jgi:hypothetical protein